MMFSNIYFNSYIVLSPACRVYFQETYIEAKLVPVFKNKSEETRWDTFFNYLSFNL